MSSNQDHYSSLGILPNAEPIVVTAAYRALASLYHPDRWRGDPATATARMAEINVAYGILSDAAKRSEYDKSRKDKFADFTQDENDQEAAFDAALAEVEERWKVATDIFPDLTTIRKRLGKTSHRLAFAFVTMMLETRQFVNRQLVADSMEKAFLERYFGIDEKIISYARLLISLGEKAAIVDLNRYVDVLGSGVDATLIINKVEEQLKVQKRHREPEERAHLKASLKKHRLVEHAVQLARHHGYVVNELGAGIFSASIFELREKDGNGLIRKFDSPADFKDWVLANLCRD